jgi:tetratricopeptide (TPR) repeat protein/transglutaminase-like putative cysteine protease
MRIVLACLLTTSGIVSSAAENTPPSAVDASSDAVRFDLVRYRDRVEEDGSSTRTMEARALLRTAAAVAELGQLAVPYIEGLGQVQFEKLVVEKADGHAVDVRNAAVEDINPFGITGSSVSADVRVKKVTIPGLEPGDILSYQFVIRQKPLTPGHIFGEMKLTPAMGDPLQSYELDLPRRAQVQVRLREGLGASWEEVPSSPDRLVRRLALAVISPAAGKSLNKEQLRAWTEPDVTFTNFRTWSEVATWWWELSRGRLGPDAAIKAEALSIVGNASSPRERMAALHHYVSSRIRYLNVNFGIGRMQPRPAPEVLTSRYGDCKDKHALLAALAAAIGIEVRPVLIHSTRSDLRDDVPSPEQFDHMISVATLGPNPSDWLWLDATNALGLPGYLTSSLRDKRALLIEGPGGGRVIRTPADPPFPSRTEVELKGAMDPEGKLQARAVWRFRSDFEVQLRTVFAATPLDRRTELVQKGFASDWPGGKVTNVFVSDPADVTEPFRVEFDVVSSTDPGRKASWSLWIPLPTFGLPNPDREGGAATTTEPVEFLLNEYTAKADFEIPEGFTLQAPLSVSVQRSYATFESTYSVEKGRINVSRILRLKSKTVPSEEVKSYASFYRAVDTDRDQKFSVLGNVAPGKGASAQELHEQGLAAFDRKEYGTAALLFTKATDADAKFKDGFLDLGRAFREMGQRQVALTAFSKQVELDPFHESAYAERAYTLIEMDRWPDAEKDLLKQIEVAPFKPWSYERLGSLRTFQKRFSEAADFYGRAAAIEPGEAYRWVDLASAYEQAGRGDDGRAALDRARGLEPPDSVKVRAAGIYARIGDLAVAGELAESAIPSLTERLARLPGNDFGTGDLEWVDRLTESWRLVGSAALARGDTIRAARYLDAAWKIGFLPEAGLALATLRAKQGRLNESMDLLTMISSIPTPKGTLPSDLPQRIDAMAHRLAGSTTRINTLMDLRTVRLACPVLKDLTEEVLLLIASDGRVEKVKGLSARQPADLDRQLSKVGPLHLSIAPPDQRAFKIVRRGLLACSQASGCAFVLDIPGLGQPGLQVANPTFDVTVVKPKSGSILRRGQREQVIVVLRYNLKKMSDANVTLRVRDQAGKSLIDSPPQAGIVKGFGEEPRQGTFLIPQDATSVDVSLEVKFVGGNTAFPVPGATYVVQ